MTKIQLAAVPPFLSRVLMMMREIWILFGLGADSWPTFFVEERDRDREADLGFSEYINWLGFELET